MHIRACSCVYVHPCVCVCVCVCMCVYVSICSFVITARTFVFSSWTESISSDKGGGRGARKKKTFPASCLLRDGEGHRDEGKE